MVPNLFNFQRLILCILLSIAVRFPFFTQVSGDEATFILVGQSLADGNLPYVVLWEIKPPLGFVFFAGAIKVFGKSIFAVHFAGALLVGVAGFMVYLIADKLGSHTHGYISAVIYIIGTTILVKRGNGLMMEHVSSVPILAALNVIVSDTNARSRTFFLAGVLLGVASLIKMNLAFLLLFATISSLFLPLSGLNQAIVRFSSMISGGLLVLILTFIPYAISGESELFYRTVFLAPLAYSETGMSFLNSTTTLSINAVSKISDWRTPLNIILWIGGFVGIFRILISLISGHAGCYTLSSWWFIVFCVGIFFAVTLSGRDSGHYLISLVPVFSVSAALLLPLGRAPQIAGPIIAALILAIGLALYSVVIEYKLLWKRSTKNNHQPTSTEVVADYISGHCLDKCTVFLLTDPIFYWLTGKKPLTPLAVFPRNIINEQAILQPLYGSNATAESEMRKVLVQSPTYIIRGERGRWVDQPTKWSALLESTIKSKYFLETTIDGLSFYRLTSSIAD